MNSPHTRHRIGTPEQCAAARQYLTSTLAAQAAAVRENQWDWHPHAQLPTRYMLAALHDGVWIIDAAVDLNAAVRLARVCDAW